MRIIKKGFTKIIVKPNDFAGKLSSDLIEVSKDLHFAVRYDPEWVESQLKKRR